MKFFIIFFMFYSFLFSSDILNYKVVNKSIVYKNKDYTVLRSFEKSKISYYLIVNENTLETKIIEKSKIKKFKTKNSKDTRYQKLLEKYKKPPFLLQNYGATQVDTKYVYITVDMCPSRKKGYEKDFFKNIIKKYANSSITLFISGTWIENHKEDFLELIRLKKEKQLDIVFGNHTFSHPYKKENPLIKNFLLSDNIDIKYEILELEKLLLAYDITPAILFRFPGLVSDKKTILLVNSLGLIPIGTNAWLAKEEPIQDGSIILVHGNKNEPMGIKKFDNIVKNKDLEISSILKDLH
ncbi:polysaccharide deacetylase family protein [Campylobacterota bacterium DY0563]